MGQVENKVALVTGGASGVGREVVLLLLREGARVLISDVNEAAGQALAATVKATPPFAPGTKVSSYPWSAGNRFQWQTAGRLRLPSGAQIINLQPTRMARAGLFADVRALRLRPAGR